MKTSFVFLLFVYVYTCYGQFAIVTDKDGFANVRSSAKITNNITDKLNNGEIVYCLERNNDWLTIDYTTSNEQKSGYIHKSRVMFIHEYEKIPRHVLNFRSITFRKDSISCLITKTRFITYNNKLQYSKRIPDNNEYRYLEKINGKEIWGTDGGIPKYQYGKVELRFGETTIQLPIANLFEPNLDVTSIYIDKPNNSVYITAENSDGAGAYAVLWVVKDGIFERKVQIRVC
ncbi:MAG: hypothetical protein U0Y96_02770 [Candidatus Kapaibacterium sp.]|nr:hypothetical protein [Bacteroidota bacterium]